MVAFRCGSMTPADIRNSLGRIYWRKHRDTNLDVKIRARQAKSALLACRKDLVSVGLVVRGIFDYPLTSTARILLSRYCLLHTRARIFEEAIIPDDANSPPHQQYCVNVASYFSWDKATFARKMLKEGDEVRVLAVLNFATNIGSPLILELRDELLGMMTRFTTVPIRQATVECLAVLGDDLVPMIRRNLPGKAPSFAASIAQILSLIPGNGSVDLLLELSNYSQVLVKNAALIALLQHAEKAAVERVKSELVADGDGLAVIVNNLAAANPEMMIACVGEILDNEKRDAFLGQLDPQGQNDVAAVLKRVRLALSPAVITSALSAAVPAVRLAALESIIDSGRDDQELRCKDIMTNDSDPSCRLHAAAALLAILCIL